MSLNPLNLVFRFLLEVAGLVAMGRFGWSLLPGWPGIVPALFIPGVAAAAWGVFRVPNDGGAPVVEVTGPVRLALEAVYFVGAIWAAAATGAGTWGTPLACAVAVHYLLSWDRVAALVTNRPLRQASPR